MAELRPICSGDVAAPVASCVDGLGVPTFLTSRDHAARNSVIWREMLGSHQPALTVVVAQTLDPDWLLETEATAASRSP